MNVLVVDVCGTHVKVLATGQRDHRQFESGPVMTAKEMVSGVRKIAKDWSYDVVSIGYPGPVLPFTQGTRASERLRLSRAACRRRPGRANRARARRVWYGSNSVVFSYRDCKELAGLSFWARDGAISSNQR